MQWLEGKYYRKAGYGKNEVLATSVKRLKGPNRDEC